MLVLCEHVVSLMIFSVHMKTVYNKKNTILMQQPKPSYTVSAVGRSRIPCLCQTLFGKRAASPVSVKLKFRARGQRSEFIAGTWDPCIRILQAQQPTSCATVLEMKIAAEETAEKRGR